MTDASSFGAVGKALSQVIDPYERRARLYPALMMLVPLFMLFATLYHDDLEPISTLASVLVSCGALFFLSDLARNLGKTKEQLLWQQWGGMPSMQVLRYSDATIDEISKKRYHEVLSRLLGMPFPSASDEASAPGKADAIYRSASTKLREATRDTKKFKLLFIDNITYGFRRNALGLKPWAIVACMFVLVWELLALDVFSWGKIVHSGHDLRDLVGGPALAVLLIAFAMLLVWVFAFTKQATRNAAFSYAQKLIEACETLDKPPQPSRKTRTKKTGPDSDSETVT